VEMLNTDGGLQNYLRVIEMKVININDSNFEKVEGFLQSVEGMKIDRDVIYNASMLVEGEEIIGVISFECFGKNALIRYFIFKKIIDEENLSNLFKNLVHKAKDKNINRIFSFVYNENTSPIFEFLGFNQIDKRQIYIEEKKFIDTKNKDAFVYCYEVA
jgi:N-acetylglutamate synthase-like GNAT family acetyltransferase